MLYEEPLVLFSMIHNLHLFQIGRIVRATCVTRDDMVEMSGCVVSRIEWHHSILRWQTVRQKEKPRSKAPGLGIASAASLLVLLEAVQLADVHLSSQVRAIEPLQHVH